MGEHKSKEDSTSIKNLNIKDKIIIGSDNQYKAIFDIFVLLMVLYSCIHSVFDVAFETNAEIISES